MVVLVPLYVDVFDGNSNRKVPSFCAVHMDTQFQRK